MGLLREGRLLQDDREQSANVLETRPFPRPFANAGVASTDTGAGTKNRPGQRTPKSELVERVKYLVLVLHMSYGQAAKVMGLPKSTVWDLVKS